jgi:large subunit ribosomal protein L13
VDALSYKTKFVNQATSKKEWILVDAENQVAGRLASKVAYLLRGKHKADFTPYVDCGANVVIINAGKIRYTGYPGGQRFATPKFLLGSKPTEVLRLAIHGMLPKNRLGRRLNTNVFIYAGTEHNQEAQQPKKIDLSTIKA